MKRATFLRALAALPFVPSSLGAVQEEESATPSTSTLEELGAELGVLECPDCRGGGKRVHARRPVPSVADWRAEGSYIPAPAGPTLELHECERCFGTGRIPWDGEAEVVVRARAEVDVERAQDLQREYNRIRRSLLDQRRKGR